MGVEYSAPLSVTRRMVFRLDVSPSLVEIPESPLTAVATGTVERRLYPLQSEASVDYPFRLKWIASASYRRGMEYVPGLTESVFTTGARVKVTGVIGRRVDVSAVAASATGISPISRTTQNLSTYSGEAQDQVRADTHLRTLLRILSILLRSRRAGPPRAWPSDRLQTARDPRRIHGIQSTARQIERSEGHVSVRSYTLNEIVSVIVRRRWLILVPFAFGVAIAPLLARFAPERYRSEALIVVIPQQVPDNYVKPTVSESVEERLPSITDQILSRSRLERIIQEMDLYKAERARGVMEDVVQTMRLDVATSAAGKDVDSFRVSYVSDNPETARKVTERLASLYIDQNSSDREAQADNTSEFLDTQLAEAKRRLIEQEKKLEDYRKSHAGQMPSQMQGNLQAIQNANLQLQSLNESTNRAQERRLLIERQLADVLATPAPLATPVAGSDTPAPVRYCAATRIWRAHVLHSSCSVTPRTIQKS